MIDTAAPLWPEGLSDISVFTALPRSLADVPETPGAAVRDTEMAEAGAAGMLE